MNPYVTFHFAVGSSRDSTPVRHNFAARAVGGLPQGQEQWNLSEAVDSATQTFVVRLGTRCKPNLQQHQ